MALNQKRILLVDDSKAIHDDFYKVLQSQKEDEALLIAEGLVYNTHPEVSDEQAKAYTPDYILDSAYQGQEAYEKVQLAVANKQNYALAFVDVRMPPGWDGIETVKHMWEIDPNIQIVICTAYSDYSWKDIIKKLNYSDNFLILKKPFDVIEIRQLAAAMTRKWELNKQIKHQIEDLQEIVKARTIELENSLSLIQAAIEATPEGILAIGKNRKTLTSNKILLKLWNIPKIKLEDKVDGLFQHMCEQINEPQALLKMLNQACERPNTVTNKEWKLKSGKILELHVRPQFLNDEIVGSVFSFRDITERKRLEEQLLYQATHDSLTGLPNRIILYDRLDQAIIHSKQTQGYIGVFAFDLDNFKEINDALGHNIGDLLLKVTATRLLDSVSEVDTVVRMGGDEFILILPQLKSENDVIAKAKEFVELFLVPCQLEEYALTITSSIGVSIYPRDGEDAMTLLKNADTALYRAKELGKNGYQIYLSEFNDHMLERIELITLLRESIEKNEFILYYQPLIKTETSRIIGMEALVRWKHPKLGLLNPQEFIGLAEETGLINQIGEWVLKEACAQAKKWQDMLNIELNIAVNVSGYQFRQRNFIETVKNILKVTGLDARYLELEMTESLIFKNIPETSEKMHELKKLGIHLAIDDFGTGYASFSYLKDFPFDKVKIDKSFIKGIHLDTHNNAIVEAIINMTNKMGIEVLTEGVENQEQVDFLKTHHGGQVQGFYYSRPLDVEKSTALLLKYKTSKIEFT